MKLRLPEYIPTKPTPKQMAFLMYTGLEAFYGGAAGGGKTEALLMAAMQYVDVPGYSAILFRRSYTDLALPGALMDRAHQWLQGHKKVNVKWDRDTHSFTFPSGATLSFGYIQAPRDKYRYQSAEFQFIAFDEITEWPDDDAYTFMFSRLRKTENIDVPLRVRSASNPVGQGTFWVKKRFVDEGEKKKGIFIPASLYDNPHIEKDSYLRSLSELPETTQNRLILGSWEEIEDAAFVEFDPEIHIVKSIGIPMDWRRWEAMDFGVSNPTAWLAAGLSPQGHTVVYGEYYSPGLISEHASKILTTRSFSWGEPTIALCDPSIKARTGFGDQGGRGETVHSEFQKHGLYLVPANNDRRAGRVRISELLKPDPSLVFPEWHPQSGQMGSPRLFITENCVNLIEQLKIAPIDPVEGDMVDPFWESKNGHAIAALRYLLTARVYPSYVLEAAGVGRVMNTRTWKPWPESTPIT